MYLYRFERMQRMRSTVPSHRSRAAKMYLRVFFAAEEEWIALEVPGRRDPRQRQEGRCEIDAADEIIDDGARRDVPGPADDRRDADALVVEPLFAPHVRAAMIAEVQDDGIVRQASFEPGRCHANLGVEVLDGFKIVGPVTSGDRMVRIGRAAVSPPSDRRVFWSRLKSRWVRLRLTWAKKG